MRDGGAGIVHRQGLVNLSVLLIGVQTGDAVGVGPVPGRQSPGASCSAWEASRPKALMSMADFRSKKPVGWPGWPPPGCPGPASPGSVGYFGLLPPPS